MDDNVKHPEAYPSIERSLDKIVDKMYGNTVEVDPPKEYAFTYKDQSHWTQRCYALEDFESIPEGTTEIVVESILNGNVLHSVKLSKTHYETRWLSEKEEGGDIDNLFSSDPTGNYFLVSSTACFLYPEKTGDWWAYEAGELELTKDLTFTYDELPEAGDFDAHSPEGCYIRLRFFKPAENYSEYKEQVPDADKSLYKIAEKLESSIHEPVVKDISTPLLVLFTDKYKAQDVDCSVSYEDIVSAVEGQYDNFTPIQAFFYAKSSKYGHYSQEQNQEGEIATYPELSYTCYQLLYMRRTFRTRYLDSRPDLYTYEFVFEGVPKSELPVEDDEADPDHIIIVVDKNGARLKTE